jgi:tetratricopeptide (TPR) repeat protein
MPPTLLQPETKFPAMGKDGITSGPNMDIESKDNLLMLTRMGLSHGLLDMALFYGHIAHQINPQEAETLCLLAQTYARKGCHEAALSILQHSGDMQCIALYCASCIALGRPDLGMKQLQTMVDIKAIREENSSSLRPNQYKNHERAVYYTYYSILSQMLGHGRGEDAQSAIKAASYFFPPLEPVFMHSSITLPLDPNEKEAPSFILSKDKHMHPMILLSKARSLHHDFGRLDQARQLYETLYTTFPYFTEGISEYSSLLWQMKDQSTLDSLAHSLLSRSFGSRMQASTWIVAANATSLHGDHSASLKALQRASMLEPTQAYIYSLMGQEYMALDAISEASQCFQRAISLSPSMRYEAYMGLAGIAMRYPETHEEVRALIQKAIAIHPKHPGIHEFYQAVKDQIKYHNSSSRNTQKIESVTIGVQKRHERMN